MSDKVAIVTDSTACIPAELVKKYNIEIIPVVFVFDGKAYLDGIDMSTAEFYERLKQAQKLPTTSGSLLSFYLDAYRKMGSTAKNILCVTVPSGLSGMYNSAQMAVRMLKDALPDVTIEVISCGTAAAGQGLVVLEAARAAQRGKTLAEVLNIAKDINDRVDLLATLDTLQYLVKGGRVPLAAALATSLLQIKPIFTINGGVARPLTTARTMTGAINRIIKMMKKRTIQEKPLHVAIMHADALDQANRLSEEITRLFICKEIFITEFTPVMGVHTGPGVVGAAFYSEE